MQLVLMRHATRESSYDADCPLSRLGHAQAGGAANDLVPHGILPTPAELFCSPKLRARQTLQPLGRYLNLELKVDERLDERHSNESASAFEDRIRDFLSGFASYKKNRVGYVCTHMDWLESCLPLLPASLTDLEMALPWAAGEFRIFEISADGHWTQQGQGVLHG